MYEENEKTKKTKKKKKNTSKKNRFIEKIPKLKEETKIENEEKEIKEIEEPKEITADFEDTEELLKKIAQLDEDDSFVKEKEEEKKEKESKTKKIEIKKWLGLKTDWTSILVKFGIFLLIAFFLIFTVTKIRQGFSKNTFTDNMEKMKSVAYTYYKVPTHRPAFVEEGVSMTLEDMEEGSLIGELKDSKNNVCSKDYSYVSLTKKSEDNYDLDVYLSCGGEAKNATYEVSYKEDTENTPTTTLYELKRNVVSHSKYTCPSGYLLSGRYCIKMNQTEVQDAIPIYRVTPEKNVAAIFKTSGTEYEYTDPIKMVNEDNYVCPSGYTKNGTKCVKYGTVKYQTKTNYTCPNGGTPSGTRCLFTTYTDYKEEKGYCKNGRSINGDECYVTMDYSVRCIVGKKDSSRNACYTSYAASKELSDWLFESKVTYSSSYTPKDSDTVYYEEDHELENGKIVYRKYVRKYIKVCDEDDTLSGSICKHYDDSYEERYCSNSKYDLTSDEKECYRIEPMEYKKIKGEYVCPSGYQKKGIGENATCYKYEPATKNKTETPYCSSDYSLTSNNECVKSIPATLKTEESYTCPAGYDSSGSGKNTVCYRKTSTNSYYYCSNLEATLEGNRCIIPSKTTFLSYRCPNGFEVTGSKCVNPNHRETILATETNTSIDSEETIWSKTKDVAGWTWTGNTKEA